MQSGTQDNAMTEIALALAMGFFSIMVLTMVSMGAGSAEPSTSMPALLTLVPSEPNASAPSETQQEDVLVVYHQGQFFDAALAPIDPQSIVTPKRVVLAVARDLSLADAMAAKARVSTPNIVVSTLDERWERALGQQSGSAGGQP